MFEGVERQERTEKVDLEEFFYREVEKLPEELASKWVYEYEGLEDPENDGFFSRFKGFLDGRKKALSSRLEIVPGTPDYVVDQVISLSERINKEYGNPESFLGEGRTAKVHIHPESPDICIKYIKDAETYTKTDVPIHEEFDRLRALQTFKFDGIRTPTPYFLDINGKHIYGMERIKGNTLVNIMSKPELNVELVKLAKTLDREMVLKKLTNYVKEMHSKFKITHNDLEVINIMLDYEGNLYVIDFGKSKYEEVGEDHELYNLEDEKTLRLAIKEFFDKIDIIEIPDIIDQDNSKG
ncbi:MAG: 3-deoxy-D-manno-octulosonic acid kinase [Parcubacteria bacterium OLB19]|nr:MAG: 3-deoxy-D-manno-octulosonic acid kinase [Parcubacteria bacterium OLB19]